jgi:glycosyltransferase involved in cell wall biosynthesis
MVHFIDFQNQQDMPTVYQACDLFCLPSKGPAETWGLAVNEAMACGKAILVSNKVGCFPNLVLPGKNGAVFKSEDVDDLANKLEELTASKALLSTYGELSQKIITEFSFAHIVEVIKSKMMAIKTPY